MPNNPHILNAASNLLGIALLIITGLNVAHRAEHSFADEVAWVAAICFSLSCLLSYAAMRRPSPDSPYERWADRIFLAGLLVLFASVMVIAIEGGGTT